MTPERYRQVNALADAALAMAPECRTAFLEEACGSDSALRKEIEHLIAADSSVGDFLDRPVLDVLARDMLARPAGRDLAGRRIERYEVISRLGAGGIGEVWLARDVSLNREVALKLLSPQFTGDPYHRNRFQQEARAASALNHPNIVTVYEIGESEGALFIAEERVDGETVRQRLARGPIPLKEIVAIGAQAAAALAAAHAAGVVHRDIKPENVMVRPDGLVKVLDFGLARFVDRETKDPPPAPETASLPGLVLGTVRYMSPEQARGLAADGRSDLFSLGVMLYEMASGKAPFSGSTPTDTLAAILTAEPPPLNAREVPAEFERIVRRCLAKDQAGRYGDAGKLKDDLERLAAPAVRQPSWRWMTLAAAGAILVALALAYALMGRNPPAAFNSMRITRVVTRGEAVDVALSADGKQLAYVVNEEPGQSVWLRDLSGSAETAAVVAEPGEHSGLTFSPEGSYLYYRRRTEEGSGDLYRVPLKGGAAQRVAGDVSGSAAVSPDGRRLAFVRLKSSSWEASLMVSRSDGSGEFSLATLQRPRYFDLHDVAWSPDGRSIACFTGEATRYSAASFRLIAVSLADGSQRAISPQAWSWPRSVRWSAKGDFLIVTAATRGSDTYQLWQVAARTGDVARVTNDLSSYDRVTMARDGRSLATVRSETTAAIWVAPGADEARAVRISATPLPSEHIAVAWAPDGRIIYSDPTGDYRNLWSVDADGGNRRRLTSSPGDKDQIAIARDGRYIVYKQQGNIWRMDAGGTNPRQLTFGPLDVHPDVSADGRSVVYASFAGWSPSIGGEPTLWRVPIEGGEAVEIGRQPASYSKVSPDGSLLGCIYFPGRDPRFSAAHVGVLRLDGAGGIRILDASPGDETEFAWSPGGKALDYIVNTGGVGNIWRQPVAGGPPTRVTSFGADELFAFAWSRTGRLAYARGTTVRGVVLIELR